MKRSEFIERFSGVYELSPWVAEQAWDGGGSASEDTLDGLACALAGIVNAQDKNQLMVLIRNHPDLAGKAAIAGELTEESTSEQSSAGIDRCTDEEFENFTNLNNAYKQKFGFPFIMAVRDSNRHAILEAFEQRLHNDTEQEFNRAIEEIHKIARFRLADLMGNKQKVEKQTSDR